MRILVTGSAGHIGREQVRVLRAAGHEVRTTDRAAKKRGDPGEHLVGDLRDLDRVRQAVADIDAVVHLGALPNDRRGAEDQVLSINTQGTWNVLLACVEAGVGRVINFSSVNALGCVGERRTIDFFPISDAHPHYPMSPYQISKHMGEELCAMYTKRYGIVTINLRPGWVGKKDNYQWLRDGNPAHQDPHGKQELWAYVDRQDVCDATLLALTVENVQNDSFLLFAPDSNSKTPTRELVETYYPEIPWTAEKTDYFAENPYGSLFDCSHAAEVLGWRAHQTWRTE